MGKGRGRGGRKEEKEGSGGEQNNRETMQTREMEIRRMKYVKWMNRKWKRIRKEQCIKKKRGKLTNQMNITKTRKREKGRRKQTKHQQQRTNQKQKNKIKNQN